MIDDSAEIVEISETSKETRESGESFDPLGNSQFKKELSYADLNFTAMGNWFTFIAENEFSPVIPIFSCKNIYVRWWYHERGVL